MNPPPMFGAPVISDRVRMIEQAVNLVNTFRYSKHGLPLMGETPLESWQKPGEEETKLTPQENRAYNAALDFLTKEFERGPADMTSMQLYPIPGGLVAGLDDEDEDEHQ